MAITVTPDGYSSPEEAAAAFEAEGLHVYDVGEQPARQSEPHWHEFDAKLYVVAGELALTEVDADIVHRCGPGALIDVPRGTMHIENFPAYTAISGLSHSRDELTKPFDKPAPVVLS